MKSYNQSEFSTLAALTHTNTLHITFSIFGAIKIDLQMFFP